MFVLFFKTLDKDSDGFIDETERDYVEEQMNLLKSVKENFIKNIRVFGKQGENNKKKLQKKLNEDQQILIKKTKNDFFQLDVNKDGKVSLKGT